MKFVFWNFIISYTSGVKVMAFKIRTKLIIAFFAIIFPFITIIGAIALYNANTIRNASLKAEAISEELHMVLSLQLAIDKSLMPGNDYIITGNSKYIDEFNEASKDVEDLIKKVEKILVVLEGMDTPDKSIRGQAPVIQEEMEIIKGVKTAWQNIKEASQKIFEIPNPVGNKEAAGHMEEMDYKWAFPAIKMLDSYREIDRKEHTEAIEELQRGWRMAWITMIGGGIILTTLGIFFAIFYSRFFTKPIETIHNGADAIAKGDFKVRLDIKTGDEIEQLSKAMNEMAKQLDTLYLSMGEKIEEGIKKFSAIAESANDAIIVLSSPDVIHFWNKKAEEIFGYKIDEVVGKSVHDLVVPQKFRERAKGGLDNFFKTGQGPVVGKVVEVFGMHKDGTEFPVELSVSAVRIRDEWQAIGIIRDITERKRAEEELKRERKKAEKYLDIADVIIIAIGSDGRVILINKKGCEVLGYQAGDVIGKDWFDNFIPQKERDAVRNIFNLLMDSKLEMGRYYENIIVNKNGEERLISWNNTIMTDNRGKITGTLSSGEDITEKKKAEAELNHRLAELEQFRKVTIQRELRMEELKRKNKELEEELKILRGMR